MEDATLARRARRSAALAIGVSSLLLFLAIARRRSLGIAFAGAIVASLSFAGAALLGQALWQQTTACVAFALGWLGWSFGTHRSSSAGYWLSLGAVSSIVAALIRPADAPIAAASFAICVTPILRERHRAALAAFAVGAVIVVACFASWNLTELGTVLPAGQSITHTHGGELFQRNPSKVLAAFLGLLFSPSRGLLWFAPIALVAVVVGIRAGSQARIVAVALVLQLFLYAAFYKWWGGVAFGPRLAAIVVWAGSFVVFGMVPRASWPRGAVVIASLITVAIGMVGLYGYDPRKWDLRVQIDRDPAAVWRVADGSIVAALRPLAPEAPAIVDSPGGPFVYCVGDTFSPVPPGN